MASFSTFLRKSLVDYNCQVKTFDTFYEYFFQTINNSYGKFVTMTFGENFKKR